MPEIIEYAVIQDYMGEVEYPLEEAIKGENRGHFSYLGYRTFGDYVQHIWRFE